VIHEEKVDERDATMTTHDQEIMKIFVPQESDAGASTPPKSKFEIRTFQRRMWP
jgi:hypothetical protein